MKLLSLKELCEMLNISQATYYKIIKPGNPKYIEDFPKPVQLFDSATKKRFSSIDVENFIARHSHSGNEETKAA
jgi:predicted DNA-binding transcriptional regulator AlpA